MVLGMSQSRLRRTPGEVCSLGLHLVRCPKYRRRVLAAHEAARWGQVLEEIAAEHGWEVLTKPAIVVRAYKGCTARVLRTDFSYLYRFAKPTWSTSYITASLGDISESTVRRYIEGKSDTVA